MRVKLTRPVEIVFNGEPLRFHEGVHAMADQLCDRVKASDPEGVTVESDDWDLAAIMTPEEISEVVNEVVAANETTPEAAPKRRRKKADQAPDDLAIDTMKIVREDYFGKQTKDA